MTGFDTIFKMREMSADDLDAAEDKLYKATSPIDVIDQRESGLFEVYVVLSGETLYELYRFNDFVFCPCGDFEFSGTGCKHIPQIMPLICKKCRMAPVAQRGKKCSKCEQADAPYLKTTRDYKPTMVGGIPI